MKLIGAILITLFIGSITLGLTGCGGPTEIRASDNYSDYDDNAQSGHHKSSRQRAFEPRGRFAPVADDILSGGL